MDLSLVFFVLSILILLPTADQTEFNIDSCPTSRRLLFFGRFNFSLGEKKLGHVSSSSKSSASSSSKSTHAEHKHGVTIYVRPQTAAELGQKVHSYSHLLKPKLTKIQEPAKVKKSKSPKKKPTVHKTITKKNTTQPVSKTRDLVAVNDQELDRCRAILGIEHKEPVTSSKDVKKSKKPNEDKKPKEEKKPLPKAKTATVQAKKKGDTTTKPLPTKEKEKRQAVKPEKVNTKSASNQKKPPINKPSETVKLTPSSKKESPSKTESSSPPPPTSTLPPVSQSSTNTKSKREKTTPPPPPTPVNEESTDTSDDNESNHVNSFDKNNSMVDRAYHFVKNMFQLSDDILDNNVTNEEIQIVSSTTEEPQRQSRKLLSILDETIFLNDIKSNDCGFNSDFNQLNDNQCMMPFSDLSLSSVSLSKRQLLSVKKNKQSTSTETAHTKAKKTNSDLHKPKVGWTYRYRISRYLAEQKRKHTGHVKRALGGGKFQSKPIIKKLSSSINSKVPKRKLLALDSDDETEFNQENIPNRDIVNSVSITQEFVPKRQLFTSQKTVDKEEETDDEDDIEKGNERRRMKSYEEITDPVEIVRSYERGLYKPRVGWQFRYRVSRYIDTLRENIREDQERLKLGLEAIKRKTPQELSGRRKRVLDKPFVTETEETPAPEEDNKPHVGWRYRYRISKMLEAKKRGEYVDDEEEKRKTRLEQQRKQQGLGRSLDEDDECVEWEYDHLDPELRKIGEEGRHVGWAYRYRIRRKLEELKKQEAETGIPFDWETLSSKVEKKVTEAPKVVSEEAAPEASKKVVGWQYRYRVSKMREAQEREAAETLARLSRKDDDQIPLHERLDPELARLTPAERAVGWQYRYRIRRKLDALKDALRESQAGKRGKKAKQLPETKKSSKNPPKEQIIKTVEESIEKILNIDDIDETPFMEYFRRASSYILFGLLPTGRKSICLLPLPVKLSFCNEDNADNINKNIKSILQSSAETPAVTTLPPTTAETSKQASTKKLRAKKEKRLKHTVPSRSIKSETTTDKIVEPVQPPSKTVKKPVRQRPQLSTRYTNNEQVKHFDEEEKPVKKIIGVESQKRKTKKRFQIIGTEVKVKPKHSTMNPSPTTTTTASIPVTNTYSPPLTTTSSPEPITVSTPTYTSRRSLSEVVQEEAATLLSTKSTYSEESLEEINEAEENLQVSTTTTTIATTTTTKSPSNPHDNKITDVEDDESSSTDSDSDSDDDDDDSDTDSNEDTTQTNDNSDSSTMRKIKRFYENAKESVHDVFDLQDAKDSS